MKNVKGKKEEDIKVEFEFIHDFCLKKFPLGNVLDDKSKKS